MKRVSIAGVGWLLAGVISAIIGVALYKTLPILGIYYVVLGVAAIAIGIVVTRILEHYRRIAVKRRAHRQSS